MRRRFGLSASAAITVIAGIAAPAASPEPAAVAAVAHAAALAASTRRLPAHLYAPYFETWASQRIAATARSSGARYFTLAFLQTPRKGSCAPAWNGDPRQPVTAGRF